MLLTVNSHCVLTVCEESLVVKWPSFQGPLRTVKNSNRIRSSEAQWQIDWFGLFARYNIMALQLLIIVL